MNPDLMTYAPSPMPTCEYVSQEDGTWVCADRKVNDQAQAAVLVTALIVLGTMAFYRWADRNGLR